ncbi:MAG: Asp-tRNA(Asn)/Glu-tRNA(Gln) amidotransferase subunit GatB [Elusimicrobiota bacterium]
MAAELEMVVGLEVHVQLGTRTKLFCGCAADSVGALPNSAVCPVCTAQPGALPVLNRRAVELAFRAALALGATLRERSVFARKNYFYPDLPKGYQISQYDQPFAAGGMVGLGGSPARQIKLTRIHMEDDAGKSLHAELPYSRIDFNRAGVALIEIVSEPDIRSAEDAHRFLTHLKTVLQYCGVSRCDMEKGELRCDANISVRPLGNAALGTKTEIKNLNSLRAVKDALTYEHRRQCAVLDAGGEIMQETRLWDAAAGRTEPMRSKEDAHDYRYFPEPDLAPLTTDAAWIERVRAELPELPDARRERFVSAYGLSVYDAGVLTAERELADYFEAVMRGGKSCAAKQAANWISSELLGKLNAESAALEKAPVSPERLAELLDMIADGTISGKIAKDVFARMWTTGESASIIVRDSGLEQVQDAGRVALWVDEAIAENPRAVAECRAGKEKAIGAVVGAVMRKSQGRANPALVNEMIRERMR